MLHVVTSLWKALTPLFAAFFNWLLSCLGSSFHGLGSGPRVFLPPSVQSSKRYDESSVCLLLVTAPVLATPQMSSVVKGITAAFVLLVLGTLTRALGVDLVACLIAPLWARLGSIRCVSARSLDILTGGVFAR